MVYGPRSDDELDAIVSFIAESLAFANGER
jgi:hypothetical protein